MRVGHTAVHVRGASDGDAGKVYVIGGANPSGPFCETFVLDLNSRCWDTVDSPGLRPRYEHAAFVPASKAGKIYVFGGANQAGNMNDIQVLNTDTNVWTTLSPAGTAPAPRTHHTTACVGDKLIVYSGGHTGADPVGDRQVHCFDAAREEWTVVAVRGDPPKPRHGHAMAAVGSKVLVHGGMAGATFYDDLHVLDLDRQAWSAVKKKRAFPCARAAHAMMAVGSNVYVFGGMNRQGALDDLHKLDTSEWKIANSTTGYAEFIEFKR
jgi:N-acetylneuraminic acid mutarotase